MVTNSPKSIKEEIVGAFQQRVAEGRQLEAIIERLLKVLKDNGFQISVDVIGLIRNQYLSLEQMQHNVKSLASHAEQTEHLLHTFTLITSSLDLTTVLNEVMDTVISFTGAERAYLMLRDKKTHELEIKVARNWDRESLSESDAVFSRSVVQRALREKQTIVTTNAATDDRFQNVQSVVHNQLRSILCIPLIIQGQAVGLLYADNRIAQDIFRLDEIPLLTAFGVQAAIAIENARLYSEVKEDLDKALSQLENLQIDIDHNKLDREVNEITESDYFQRIAVSARTMRGRFSQDFQDK